MGTWEKTRNVREKNSEVCEHFPFLVIAKKFASIQYLSNLSVFGAFYYKSIVDCKET